MKWSRNISRRPNPNRRDVEDAMVNLPRSGVVMKHTNGGIFLDLDDDWVYDSLKVVSKFGYEIPPFFDYSGGEGAHVKIAEDFEINGDPESVLGIKVNFDVVRAYFSFPNLRTYGLDNILKMHIESAELHQMREELTGKKKPPNGNFFFIVLAVRKIEPLRTLGMKSDSTENKDNNNVEREIQEEEEDVLVEVDKNEEEKKITFDKDEEQDDSIQNSQMKKLLLSLDDNRKKVLDDLNSILTLTAHGLIEAGEDIEGNDNEQEFVNPNLSLMNMTKDSLLMFSEDLIKVRIQIVFLLMEDQEKESIMDSPFGAELSLSQKLLTVNEVMTQFECWTTEVFSTWIRQSVLREDDRKMMTDLKAVMSSIVMNYVTLISALRNIKEDIEDADNDDHPEFNMYV